jgi:hypothetical protein
MKMPAGSRKGGLQKITASIFYARGAICHKMTGEFWTAGVEVE